MRQGKSRVNCWIRPLIHPSNFCHGRTSETADPEQGKVIVCRATKGSTNEPQSQAQCKGLLVTPVCFMLNSAFLSLVCYLEAPAGWQRVLTPKVPGIVQGLCLNTLISLSGSFLNTSQRTWHPVPPPHPLAQGNPRPPVMVIMGRAPQIPRDSASLSASPPGNPSCPAPAVQPSWFLLQLSAAAAAPSLGQPDRSCALVLLPQHIPQAAPATPQGHHPPGDRPLPGEAGGVGLFTLTPGMFSVCTGELSSKIFLLFHPVFRLNMKHPGLILGVPELLSDHSSTGRWPLWKILLLLLPPGAHAQGLPSHHLKCPWGNNSTIRR